MHNQSDAVGRHDGVRLAMRGLVVAPVDLKKPGIRILDSGTGDAHWIRDLLEQYTELTEPQIIGTDITDANFPKDLPSPTELRLQSITAPWPSQWHKHFDFVHQRLVLGACGAFPFKDAVKNLTELVRPGGWIQLVEADQTCGVRDGPAMKDFLVLVTWVFEQMGGNTRYAYAIKQWLLDAGMEQVEEYSVAHFLGAQISDPDLVTRSARSTADAMTPLIRFVKAHNAAPIPTERLDSLASRLYDELIDRGGYYPLRVVWGRAPQ